MAFTPDPPTIVASDRSPISVGEGIAATSFSGDIDLNSLNDTLTSAWNVEGVVRMTITAKLRSGTWGTATVQVRGSLDGANWTVITTLTAVGTTRKIDVSDYQFVDMLVNLVESAAGIAEFASYGFTPPF